MTVDGASQENPLLQKAVKVAIHHSVKHNLDASFVAAKASERSAFTGLKKLWHYTSSAGPVFVLTVWCLDHRYGFRADA